MNVQIYEVPVSEIKESGFNPPSRTRIRHDDPLLISMRVKGFDPEYPVMIGIDGRLGDGHRRLACAKLLGIDKIWVRKSTKTAEELVLFNYGTRPIKTSHWDYMSKRIEPPPPVKRKHERLKALAGPDAVDLVVEYNKATDVVSVLAKVIDYTGQKNKGQVVGRKILHWLVSQNQIHPARMAMQEYIDPAVLIEAINNNRPLLRGRWVAG